MHRYGSMWLANTMMFGWLLLTVLIVALMVWLVVRNASPGKADEAAAARQILAERYARGELDTEEYTRRRAALR